MDSVGVVLKLLILSGAVFVVAFATERIFLPHVVPIAWAEKSQSLWMVEAAFLLRAVENVAAIVAGIVLMVAGMGWVQRRVHRRS